MFVSNVTAYHSGTTESANLTYSLLVMLLLPRVDFYSQAFTMLVMIARVNTLAYNAKALVRPENPN